MVVRRAKKNRKFLGTRRWGVGNIKNARGAGSRGGVGGLARLRKHDWTYYTAKAPELIRKKGFAVWKPKKNLEITLDQISRMLKDSKDAKATLELRGYKVISNGSLSKPAMIKADGFSAKAAEKIKSVGGEAILTKQPVAAKPAAPAPAK